MYLTDDRPGTKTAKRGHGDERFARPGIVLSRLIIKELEFQLFSELKNQYLISPITYIHILHKR